MTFEVIHSTKIINNKYVEFQEFTYEYIKIFFKFRTKNNAQQMKYNGEVSIFFFILAITWLMLSNFNIVSAEVY